MSCGIDRPLVITKDGQSIIPHQNWRGQFARGTYPNGYRSDCTSYPASGCTPIQWPGERTSARHELEPDPSIQNWYGGLVDGMRDASGQMYMRNRYYDPATGQFTQTDPIGLEGGLNAYGFAEGDPVSYDDPYGLCAFGIGRDAAMGTCGDALGAGDQQQPGGPRGGRGGGRFGGRRPSIPGGSLRANEGNGKGHTIRDHVNKTRAQIIDRARQAGAARSRFTSLAEAETMVHETIARNQVRIEQWMAPGNYSLDLAVRYTPGRPVGEVAHANGSVTTGLPSASCCGATNTTWTTSYLRQWSSRRRTLARQTTRNH